MTSHFTDLDQTGKLPFPRSAADLDMTALSAITERDGFAVYDPGAPGGFRELSTAERDLLERERARELPEPSAQGPVADHIDVVRERGANEAFPYLPAAEFNDPGYREPRSQDEADARIAWLDHEHARTPAPGPASDPGPPRREPTEVETALVDAGIDAHYSALAHDGDPRPARRVDELEALEGLRPLSEPQPERLPEHAEHQQHQEPEHEQHEPEEPGHEELELELDEDEELEL